VAIKAIDVALEQPLPCVVRPRFRAMRSPKESTPKLLVFKKGSSVFLGSKMVVVLSVVSDSNTRITIIQQSWALFDWGRGKRAGHKMLAGLDAKS
jgi:hypothetical protein